MLASTSVGQTVGLHDVVLLPQLILGDTMRGSAGIPTMSQQQQPKIWMPSQSYANYAMGPQQVCFSFRFEPLANSLLGVGVCYGVYFLLSWSHVVLMFTNWGSTIGVCDIATHWSIPLAGICVSWWWSAAHARSALSGCFSHFFQDGGASCYTFSCPQPVYHYGQYRALETPDPSAFPTWWGGVFFSR